MVEGALAGFIFLLMLFAVVEFGLAFFDYLTTANMTRVGARTASTMGNDPLADYQIVQKLKASTSAMPQANIQFIVVYKASDTASQPTAACLSASQTNVCNRYTVTDFAKASTQFGCGTGKADNAWCPTTRKVGGGASATTGPPDYVGVYIKVIHPNVTGLFGPSYTYTDATVIRIEAETP